MDYTIQPGDTLGALAQRFGTTVQALAQANGIANPNMIRAGATLRVPGAGGAAPQPAARPAGAPAPTTGAVPRPRPASVAAMDPMAAPMPQPNPMRAPPPPPRPNVERPGGMMQAQLQASGEREMALQQQQEQERLRMQQQEARWRQQPAAAPQAPQPPPAAPTAAPASANVMATYLPNGMADLPTLNQNRFNEFRLALYDDPALRNDPRFMAAVEAEAQRRVEMLRLDLDRINRSSEAYEMRSAAWQNAGQQMPRMQGPPGQPIPGNPANPMPQGQQMPSAPLDPYGPAQLQGWEDRFMAGQPNPPQMDPVAALIEQLRSGSGTNRVPMSELIRVLQAGV